MKDVTTTKKLNIKAIVSSIVTIVVLAGAIAFLALTTTGQAIVFAIQDPATVNYAADMKADYIKHFELSASSPKAE